MHGKWFGYDLSEIFIKRMQIAEHKIQVAARELVSTRTHLDTVLSCSSLPEVIRLAKLAVGLTGEAPVFVDEEKSKPNILEQYGVGSRWVGKILQEEAIKGGWKKEVQEGEWVKRDG